MEYIGKICPFCKSEFKESDEIIICSECNMPHHKDCWIENQGCTTFGCLGTIQNAGSPEQGAQESPSSTNQSQASFCPQCGNALLPSSSFCSKCGTRVDHLQPASVQYAQPQYNQTQYAQPQYAQSQSTQPHYAQPQYYSSPQNAYGYSANSSEEDALIGQNVMYYKCKFQTLRSMNKKSSWNWVAFFFPFYWFIYRKMFGWGFGLLAANLIITIIANPVLSMLSIGVNITMGILANYLYMKKITAVLNNSQNLHEPYKSQYINKHSGVSVLGLVLTIVGWALAAFIINFAMLSNGSSNYSNYYPTSHYCEASGCYEYAVSGSPYCFSHKCLKSGCEYRRRPGSYYCSVHD